MEKKFSLLRFFGTLHKVLGVIVGIITMLIVLGLCAASIFGGAAIESFGSGYGVDTSYINLFGGVVGGLMVSAIAILYGGGLALTLYAIGEGVHLLLALEENTRATAILIERQIRQDIPPQTTN
jgi:uncharacterized membrane protein